MKYSEGKFNTVDNLGLFTRTWRPEGDAKAVICLVHGLGEHCGRYEAPAGFFADRGYIFTAFDLRGHGKSQGAKGHTPSFEHLMKDIDIFLREAAFAHPGLPVILYGHSLGGNLVLNYALRYLPKIVGVISTSPWLKLVTDPGILKLLVAGLTDLLFPSLAMPTGLKSDDLSGDGEVKDKYEKDPLVHGLISARMFKCVSEAGKWALENAGGLKVPLLLMHGSQDKITSCEASMEFAGRLHCQYDLKIWNGLHHELHNEVNGGEIIDYMLNWLDKLRESKN